MEEGVAEWERIEAGRTADLTAAARVSGSGVSSLTGSDCMPRLCLSFWVL